MLISSSIEVFWGALELLGTYYRHIHSLLDSTKNMLFGGELQKMVFLQKIF